jgi:hypothetical protein
MQDASERMKRRRLNGDDNEDLVAARGRMQQAAAFASNDGTSIVGSGPEGSRDKL